MSAGSGGVVGRAAAANSGRRGILTDSGLQPIPLPLSRFENDSQSCSTAVTRPTAACRSRCGNGTSDSTRRAATRRAQALEPVRVTAPRVAPRTVTFLPERQGAVLLTGKKSEVLLVDSVGANTAQNVARQVLGRVPGLVVAETEGGGFPSNGIAVRGLDPTQSVEMNVRQNGVIVSADPYGYSETYYLPPCCPRSLAPGTAVRRPVFTSYR
jgi:hypothetical protein